MKASITDDTVAICVTHFLGFPAKMKEIYDIAKENNLFILQDACETMKLSLDGKVSLFYEFSMSFLIKINDKACS